VAIKLATMPTYEYVCSKCGHEFEKFQPIADRPLAVCTKDLCAKKRWGKGKVKRKISTGGGLIFKGSGFYITDYRSENYKESAKKDSAAAKPASEGKPAGGDGKPSGGETKSPGGDSKPASKPESKPAESKPAESKPAKSAAKK
jgi:putative FmdB family regulatory protein